MGNKALLQVTQSLQERRGQVRPKPARRGVMSGTLWRELAALSHYQCAAAAPAPITPLRAKSREKAAIASITPNTANVNLADPALATGMLSGMMIIDLQRAVMFGRRAAPNAEEIVARANACAKIFLGGCRVRAG